MFKEAQPLNLVAKFHRATLHPVEERPIIPDINRSSLRIKLLQEELNELKYALKEENLELILDALCDLQYVLSGAIHEFGLGHIFNKAFNEVQRSNMTKICSTKKEAIETIAFLSKKNKSKNFEYKKVNNKYPVFRSSDNKVMKSINYSPPKIGDIGLY
jgi:predicted HAD superfamily Cof-like phosphohydrolase